MFEAIRGSTCQQLLRAKPPQLGPSRRSIACAPRGLFRAESPARNGNWGPFSEPEYKHKSLHGEALPFASIGTLVMERLAALNKVFGHGAALKHY